MSLAALMLKNLGGPSQNPGQPIAQFFCANPILPGVDEEYPLGTDCDPRDDQAGGLFEEMPQDEFINPGTEADPAVPLLPAYLAAWASNIPAGEAHPDLDEAAFGVNTLTDVATIEGFSDVLGPFNPAATLNEVYSNTNQPQEGTWPIVNRVGRMGSFKAAQLREVELTGPYFHNGGKLTLRQVVDFYARGGDFPATNSQHRDFNLINLDIEVQSNLTEVEKVALVDFLLEFTDERVRFERGPFDHPEVFVPLDGAAPENGKDAADVSPVPAHAGGRSAFLANIANGMFRQVKAVGLAGRPTTLNPADPGNTGPLGGFLGVERGNRNSPQCDPSQGPISHYCH
jgi:hypothetical protein